MKTQDAQELAQTLFEEIGDAAFIVDPESMWVVDANPMAERLTRMPRERLLRMNMEQLFRSEEVDGLDYLLRALNTTQTFHSQEGFLLRRGLDDRWTHVNITLTRLHSEDQLLGLVLARDVTERFEAAERLRDANALLEQHVRERTQELSQANADLEAQVTELRRTSRALELSERRLRESEARLRTILDSEPECVKTLDRQGRVLEMNRAGLAILGADSLSQVLGQRLDALAVPEYREQVSAFNERVFAGEPQKLELEIVNFQGQRRWVEMHAAPLRDSAGEVHSLLSISRDITDRKLAELNLLTLERAIREAPIGILIVDCMGIERPVVYVSPGYERLTGESAGEMLGRPWRIPEAESADAETTAILRSALAERQGVSAELLSIRTDGAPFWNHVVIAPVHDASGQIVQLAILQTDVTARRRLEDQLRQASKMEAIGQLAGGIAHDFNNLLTIINGYSEILLARSQPGEPARTMIESVRHAGERAASLTRQLLAFSRQQALVPRSVDLNAIVADIDKLLGRLLGEDIAIVQSLEPALWPVKVDSSQIEQSLLNLCVNARDAMPKGGRIVIETRNRALDDPAAAGFADCPPGRYVSLAVADDGVGMTPDVQSHIFEPFFTTKPAGKGTGLGLATVFGIVKQSSGHIRVVSAADEGARFEILFPAILNETVDAGLRDVK